MVQPADQRQLDYVPRLGQFDTSRVRAVFAQRQMRPAPVVVLRDELSQESSQMPLVHHDDVIEKLPPEGADYPLHIGRLPGGTRETSTISR